MKMCSKILLVTILLSIGSAVPSSSSDLLASQFARILAESRAQRNLLKANKGNSYVRGSWRWLGNNDFPRDAASRAWDLERNPHLHYLDADKPGMWAMNRRTPDQAIRKLEYWARNPNASQWGRRLAGYQLGQFYRFGPNELPLIKGLTAWNFDDITAIRDMDSRAMWWNPQSLAAHNSRDIARGFVNNLRTFMPNRSPEYAGIYLLNHFEHPNVHGILVIPNDFTAAFEAVTPFGPVKMTRMRRTPIIWFEQGPPNRMDPYTVNNNYHQILPWSDLWKSR